MKTTSLFSLRAVAFAVGALFFFAAPFSWSQLYYTNGHGDIGVGYHDEEFEPHWHLEGNLVGEFEPDEVVAWVQATRPSPTGLSTGLGVADGTMIWAAGSAIYQPNLGFSTEELNPSDWSTPITFSLVDWSGPGEFALFSTNLAGTTVADIVWSSFNPGSTVFGNSLPIVVGGHVHFSFGFTTPGYYELEIQFSGTHIHDGVISDTATFGFQVVPEPGIWALLAVGFVVVLFLGRKRTA